MLPTTSGAARASICAPTALPETVLPPTVATVSSRNTIPAPPPLIVFDVMSGAVVPPASTPTDVLALTSRSVSRPPDWSAKSTPINALSRTVEPLMSPPAEPPTGSRRCVRSRRCPSPGPATVLASTVTTADPVISMPTPAAASTLEPRTVPVLVSP